MPATTWKATQTLLGSHMSPPTITADGTPNGVIYARSGTICFENDNVWVKREGTSYDGWAMLAFTTSSVIFETLANGAIIVEYAGMPGDVIATYNAGLAVITVMDEAKVRTVRIYGVEGDLVDGAFNIRMLDPCLGTGGDDARIPRGKVTSQNGIGAPTEAFPWEQIDDGEPVFSMFYSVSAPAGTGMEFQFANAGGLTSHIFTLTF